MGERVLLVVVVVVMVVVMVMTSASVGVDLLICSLCRMPIGRHGTVGPLDAWTDPALSSTGSPTAWS